MQLSVRASEAAAAVYAWDEALSHLRAALKLLERAGGPLPERARLAERAARLVYQASVDLEEGIGHLQTALACYLAVGDELGAARIHSQLGMHLTTWPATLDVPAALDHYQTAEAVLARQPARRSLSYLYVGMAMAAVFGVRTDRLGIAARRAVEIAETLGDDRLAGWARYQQAWWAFNAGRLAESLALHQRARHRNPAGRRAHARLGGVRSRHPQRHLPGRPVHRRRLVRPGPGRGPPGGVSQAAR